MNYIVDLKKNLESGLIARHKYAATLVGSKHFELFSESIRNELFNATVKFHDFNSYHEGYAVILEEVDELWDEIKNKEVDRKQIERELLQVAAMCFRFYLNLIADGLNHTGRVGENEN